MPSLPDTQPAGTETIRGISFQVDRGGEVEVAHAWVGDTVSGLVFVAVEDDRGEGRDKLRENLIELLDRLADYCHEETGEAASLVGLGSDYDSRPAPGWNQP